MEALFVHVPKTAGTSVTTALLPHELLRISSLKELRVASRPNRSVPRFLTLDHLSTDWLVRSGLISKAIMETVPTFAVQRKEEERKISALRHLSTGRIPPRAPRTQVLKKIEKGLWPHCCKNVFGLSLATNPSRLLAGPRFRGPINLFQFDDLPTLEEFLSNIFGQRIELQHEMRGSVIGGHWELREELG